MKNILLLAPPAAGKGTNAEFLQKKYGFVPISTGDLLREESKKDTPLGRKIAEVMKSGQLIDDETVIALLKEKLHSVPKTGFLFDGFPRNIEQAKELDHLLQENSMPLTDVFFLEVDKETLEKRITGRRICKECGKIYNLYLDNNVDVCSCGGELYQRSDDTKEAFQTRYQTYVDATLPLVDYYEKKNILHRIHADGTIDEVFHQISSIIDQGGNYD